MQHTQEKAKVLLIAVALLSSAARAGDLAVKYGGSVAKENEPLALTKSLFLSYQSTIHGPFLFQAEAGGWVDNQGDGRSSSLLFSPSVGVQVNAGYVYSQALVGPALITQPDSILGGPFQFNNDVAVGIRDPQTHASFGLNYKHVSSAGIESPNKGRDLLMFRVSVPW